MRAAVAGSPPFFVFEVHLGFEGGRVRATMPNSIEAGYVS